MQIKSYCLVACLIISSVTGVLAQSSTTTQYIERYKTIAMEEERRTGIPAAIKLAQGILETQSGNGWLVLNSNNHFGIKCKNNWAGKSVNYDDDEKQECFRKYESAEESYKDHSEFLRNNPRYKFLFDYQEDDYKSWAYGLKTAGYATSKTYPQQLITLIENYDLQQYTMLAMGKEKLPANNNAPVFVTPEGTATAAAYEPVKVNYPMNTEFKINGRKVMYAPAGTALIQIAEKKNIRLSTLLKYNDITEDVPLEKDMLVFLQSKNKKGQNDFHVVAPGETLHDIAQAEGVQLHWLYRRNKMSEGEQPAAGEKIALDGYASSKPKLGSNSVAKVDDYKDLDPKKIISDVRTEIEKAKSAPVTAQQEAPATKPSSGIPKEMVEDLKKIGGNATPQGSQYHTVGEKETLYSISRKYNITVAQLQAWNNLSDSGIKIGQQLVVRK